jgi:hypothetical protein
MPLKRMLEGRNFDSKAVAIIIQAFNEIIDELDLRTPAERLKAAKIVIELAAKEADLDVARLHNETVRLMRGEGMDAHGHDLNQLGGLQGRHSDPGAGRMGAGAAD